MTRTKAVREEVVVGRIRRYLKALPTCHFEKRWGGGPFARVGLPDISGCIAGRSFQLEVKRPGGVATDLQLLELGRWAQAGAVTGVVCSVEEVRELFEQAGLVEPTN